MILAAPATLLTALVTLLAILIAIGTQIYVGRVRGRSGIMAPAMTGSPELATALRIEGNSLEQYVLFVPALWLAALYFQGWIVPIIGLVWCVGRVMYAVGYSIETSKRYPGYLVSTLAALALIVLAAIGIANAWIVTTA